MHLIVGTAGHIDHGKTTLVKALTGVDTDRLPEEKQRGITIDLGFAELEEADARISFVDVPGHERFVKNMLAGASGIDVVLLVVAADEGVMPQAREHFEICRLLHVRNGVVAITKADTADAELLELVRLEIAELVEGSFLENAPVFAVSARTGVGVGELKQALFDIARNLPERQDPHITRLPIDRSFTVRGFGAVVTGTLASGTVTEGEELELTPIGEKVRVRGIQTHGRSVKTAGAGRRVAINLGGIDHDEIKRGMTLTRPNVFSLTQMIDAEVEVLGDVPRPLRSRQRVRVHLGTAEILARVAVLNSGAEIGPGSRGFVQLRLELPVAAVPGERFIIRSYSPQTTIGGGRILLNLPEKHRPIHAEAVSKSLAELAGAADDHSRSVNLLLRICGRGMTRAELQARTGWRDDVLDRAIAEAAGSGQLKDAFGVFVPSETYDPLLAAALSEIEAHHKREPLSPGIPREVLQAKIFGHTAPELFRSVVRDLEAANRIVVEGTAVKLAAYRTTISEDDERVLGVIRSRFAAAGLQVPKTDEIVAEAAREAGSDAASVKKLVQFLLKSGELTKVSDEYLFAAGEIEKLISAVRDRAAKGDRSIDVPAFKEMAGISRKYAIPLLEFFDREKITRRDGDRRIIL